MGCGCNKGMRGVVRRNAVSPRQNTVQVNQTPRPQIQTQSTTTNGLSSGVRTSERERREGILRKLGRL